MKIFTSVLMLIAGIFLMNNIYAKNTPPVSAVSDTQLPTQPPEPIQAEPPLQPASAVQTAQPAQSIAQTNNAAMTGEEFLKQNSAQPGVVTLSDGLQYKVLVNGKGSQPKDTDVVTVNYEGKLIDGTEFDSSYKRGEPAKFPVNGVIAGWTEALKLMKVGSTWMLYVPPQLAYGEQGAPPAIGPNQTLIFKVDLIAID